MRKKVFFKIMTIACAALLCSGCGNAEKTSKTEEDFSVVKQMRMQVKEEGIFYIDGYTEMMRFYDFSLGESLPLCDRPNCEHNSAQCNAYFSQGYMSGMGCYRDKIYFYRLQRVRDRVHVRVRCGALQLPAGGSPGSLLQRPLRTDGRHPVRQPGGRGRRVQRSVDHGDGPLGHHGL